MADGPISTSGSEIAAANIAGTDVIPLITSGPTSNRTTIAKLVAAIKRFFGVTTSLSAVSSTLTIDLDGVGVGRHNLTGDITIATSNRADGKSYTFFLFGHASNSYNITYPAWKNIGGTSLPTVVAANAVYKFNLNCFGTTEASVHVEFVNGLGTALTLSVPASSSFYKGGSANAGVTGGAGGHSGNGSWVVLTVSLSRGTFTLSANYIATTSVVDVDTGRYTSGVFISALGNTPSSLSAITCYGTGTPGTGSLSVNIYDLLSNPAGSSSIIEYGDDEIQNLAGTTDGSTISGSFTGALGRCILTSPQLGSTADFDVNGNFVITAQAALDLLHATNRPVVAAHGDGTVDFTFSAGAYAHTDVSQMSMTPNTTTWPLHDGSGAGNIFSQTTVGDNASTPDSYTLTWDGAPKVGWITVSGVHIPLNPSYIAGTYDIDGITWSVSGISGSGFILTAPDFVPHGALSGSISCGLPMTVLSFTTTREGNS